MNRIFVDDYNCCGCTSCASICPHDAIEMKPNALGFLYPHIDEGKCVDCGLCKNVCQFHEGYTRYDNFDKPLVYGGRLIDESELSKSQSGGASRAIIKHFFSAGEGVVCGVCMEGTRVFHDFATSLEECDKFRGSKYVQSDLRGVFPQIKEMLSNNQRILFFGTPCQVAGLRSYIGKKMQENLTVVDLVCHAVPSPKVWEDYCLYIQNKYKEKPQTICFRDKSFGWHSHIETFQLKKEKVKSQTFAYHFFYTHIAVRKSCSKCPYTNFNRVGDLSISDFWGWEKHHKEWNDNLGVSLILVNSDKGKIFFEHLKNMDLIQSNEKECLQPQLQGPISLHPNIDKFITDYKKFPFRFILYKYGNIGVYYHLKKLFKVLKRKGRNFLGLMKSVIKRI